MTVQLNHTIVWCRDKAKSAAFYSDVLGLPPPTRFGPFQVVQLHNDVSLDFSDNGEDTIVVQHYAFLIDETTFDQVFARLRERGLAYWADPARCRGGEINRTDGGRGVYFQDPDGHLLEVLTRPYQLSAFSGPQSA
ncbi:MAG TPA: VOC family protein [Casimicrobiaceae bacterium]|nr:VOC family protein [Casimicrobiaceae bacterium]